jgi:hypothetical protein
VGREVDILEVVGLEVEEREKDWVIEEESNFAVERKLTEGIHTSMLTPVEVASICSEEDDDEAEKQANIFTPVDHAAEGDGNKYDDEEKAEPSIDLVDGTSAHHSFPPNLPTHSPSSPNVLDSPTSSLPITYCPCCPGMDLEWDELSMEDDIVVELRCFSLPYGLDEHHFMLAAKDDLDDLADEGVDLRMWGGECVVVDVDDEEDEEVVEKQFV